MIIGQTLNGAVRTTYSLVTLPFSAAARLPFSAAARMMHQGARGIISAAGRLGACVLFGILATGRGIRRTVYMAGSAVAWAFWSVVNLAIKVLRSIEAGIRHAILMVLSAITSVYRSAVRLLTLVGQTIKDAALFVSRTLWRSMVWTLHMITTVAFMPFRLAAMSYTAARRSTARMSRRLTDFIGARYRALLFSSSSTSMTLSMEDGRADLLVLKGGQIIAWRSGQVDEPPEVTEPVTEDGSEPEKSAAAPVFNPLGSVLDGLPARSKRVVADLPLHMPLLRHIPLPEVKGKFLSQIVNTEVLNSVPFSQDEVDIQWCIEQGEDSREASVIAIPRERMDHQIDILHGSQLAPAAVYSKATALAVAVARRDVFILHMTQGQTAVILVREGVTRIVHRLELPSDIDEQLEAIAMGVGQVAGYHRSQRPGDDVASLPVVVTGELEPVNELVGRLETTLDRPVLPFEPEVDCPQGFDPARFASNIGLHLASQSKRSTKMISTQNVLPERYRPRPLPVVPVAVFAVLLLFAFLAFNVAGWVSVVSQEAGPLNAKLDIRDEQNREYRLAIARQNVVGQRIADADTQALGLLDNLDSFEEEMGALLSRLNDIMVNAGLSNVDLTRLVPMPEGFSVSGSALSYSDVLEYAALMRDSPNFHDATVLQVADSTGSRLGFTVVITVAASESGGED